MKIFYLTAIAFISTIFIACGSSPSSNSSSASTNGNTELYLAYSSGISKRVDSLYKTDGTSGGTQLITSNHLPTNLSPYSYALIDNFYDFGDYLYYNLNIQGGFFGNTERLYRVHKTSDNFEDLSSINVRFGIYPAGFLKRIEINNKLYYLSQSTNSTYADITTFTPTGTQNMISLQADFVSIVSPLAKIGNDVFTSGSTGTTGKMYKFDSTTSNVVLSEVVSPSFDLFVSQYYPIGTKLYMLASPIGTSNQGIWVYDTAIPATPPVFIQSLDTTGNEDIVASYIEGTSIYFSARNGVDYNIFKLDTANNNLITQVTYDTTTFNDAARNFVNFNSDIYFVKNSELRKLSAPTVVITTNVEKNSLFATSNKLYFSASTSATGKELYSYDGVSTVLEYDINAGTGDSNPTHINEVNGKIVFQATPDSLFNKLFAYDGTTLVQLN